jgi:hypothetical protein
VKIDLPEDVSPKAVEGIELFVRCCIGDTRLTGTLVFEFTEGHPVLARRTDTTRFGHKNLDRGERRKVG